MEEELKREPRATMELQHIKEDSEETEGKK